jgi:outer membrane protein assembly factor BamE (lipoprotein component of BamABCDE complex)
MKRALFRSSAVALMLAAGAAACSPTRTTHGFITDAQNSAPVQVGVDTKSSVLARMGTPSTTAAFDEASWYYISSAQQRYAFFRPRTVDRTITVVRFDGNDMVSAVDRYGMERGRVVAFNDDVTPTRGRELGLIEQIFGNIGNTAPIRPMGNEDGPRRDRNRN